MVADDLHAGPLVPEVRPGKAASRRQTLRCLRSLQALLAQQSEYRTRLRNQTGGKFVDAAHFTSAGGQILSLLSLCSYLGKGENRERYLGVRIPPAGLKPEYAEQARTFANELAKRVGCDARN
jgi:hypothetical protein